MNSPADNTVPSYLMGDSSETLLNIKNRGDDSETGSWLSSLVSDALEIAAHGDAEQPVTDADVDVMVRWVAQIFNEFELYKIEFNKKAAGSDLIVAASPLNLENLSASNDHFEGHLSTRYWSLAFDASTRRLDVYLIPAELVLAFTTSRIDETEYKPFITFTPRRQAGEYYWSVDQQLITFDMLPKLAKELFGDLIKVASGNVTEDEFFRNAQNESAAAAPHAADSAPTDRSYEVEAPSASVFESAAGGRAPLHAPVDADSAGPATSQAPRTTALTEEFFQLCNRFSDSIDREMKAVIEFARMNPEDVELLKNCKQILIEMDALRVSTTQSSDKLRKLQ
ncbi:MAG: hypothetical protein HYX67_16540 [Candidatus Melainabacteria bacterium]|nr:hypothetical protein [Candidatus Melainabacteria bacterium]